MRRFKKNNIHRGDIVSAKVCKEINPVYIVFKKSINYFYCMEREGLLITSESQK